MNDERPAPPPTCVIARVETARMAGWKLSSSDNRFTPCAPAQAVGPAISTARPESAHRLSASGNGARLFRALHQCDGPAVQPSHDCCPTPGNNWRQCRIGGPGNVRVERVRYIGDGKACRCWANQKTPKS